MTKFQNDIAEIDLRLILHGNNINAIYDSFQNQFLKILDDNAPFKTRTNREIKFSLKPWITKDIQK